MLFGVLAADRIRLNDRERFLFGCILPDAYVGPENRRTAHFIRPVHDTDLLYFDFHGFRDRFSGQVMTDDLYLGYYAHLVTDAFYRHYIFNEIDLRDRIPQRSMQILHHDYGILNGYITKKYRLPAGIEVPAGFENEAVNGLTVFDAGRITRAYLEDMTRQCEGTAEFLTGDMLDVFTERYAYRLADELRAVRGGHSVLNTADYRYPGHKR